jgi:hypothetical protein
MNWNWYSNRERLIKIACQYDKKKKELYDAKKKINTEKK